MGGTDDNQDLQSMNPFAPQPASSNQQDEDEHPDDQYDDDDDDDDDEEEDDDAADAADDPFGDFGGPGFTGAGLSSTLRALTGMMAGLGGRLRDLLTSLKADDESIQLIALQELSEILLVSNEDNLTGHFSPDSFVKELVALMGKEDCPEIMLLACRCLANLMEALPASVANVVYGGAVPVLCQKLLEISFIDLAEQSLSTLEKISVEYPSSIVREGGLTACLSYLDFFPTGTQRTAVTTAANCCRNINEDSFPVVRDVMPTLLNVLNSSDQRVVEKASLCVTGIVESFKFHPSKLEELVSVDLLRTILRLLVPGTTNLIGSNIHTQFLRVLAFTARASPRLSADLFKLNVVETLYQILTGVSPPSGTEDVASKLDSVVVMQALIHRPREQIIETLNVICELLPSLPRNADPSVGDFVDISELSRPSEANSASSGSGRRTRRSPNDKRVELLEECKVEVRRFALIIFPTLTDAFSSTVNLSVRQKVLTAHLKMLSNLDTDILTEALVPVPYASFLASILSQKDHPSLVMLGLQATEMLVSRLNDIYRYQFYREGVINEIQKLANEEIPPEETPSTNIEKRPVIEEPSGGPPADDDQSEHDDEDDGDDYDGDDHESSGDDNEDHDDDAEDGDEDGAGDDNGDDQDDEEDEEGGDKEAPARLPDEMSPVSSRGSTMSIDLPSHRFMSTTHAMKLRIREVANQFIETHEKGGHGDAMKAKANAILVKLSDLAVELEDLYLKDSCSPASTAEKGEKLFIKLASYFDTDVLESVTSAELLASGLVRVLLEIFSNPDEQLARRAQATFLSVSMDRAVKAKPKTTTADSPATPFSIMIHKLQDLLSRSEHFEVITVHQNSFDGNRSSQASMLGKQIRLRLIADENSNIPGSYQNIMVSIHAIATFKALDDYLRPRISLSERPPRSHGLSRALAAMAGSSGSIPLSPAAVARFADRMNGIVPPPPPPPAAGSSSRPPRRAKNRGPSQSEDLATSNPLMESSSRETTLLRRSTRKSSSATHETPVPNHPPFGGDEQPQSTLECADEKPISDDEPVEEGSALDAIVGDFDEDMHTENNADDPSAVNMEFAKSGNVHARRDDGTRIPTPAGAAAAIRAPPSAQSTPTPGTPVQGTPSRGASSSRPMSYASAIQAIPQDWHIEFTLDDKPIPLETTIYRAVHTSSTKQDDNLVRSIWSATHPIKYKRVQGPPPAPDGATFGSNPDGDSSTAENGIPASLAKHPTTASILRLLRLLHDMNANIDDILLEEKTTNTGLSVEPLTQFVNTKLTAKLNRQLEEPLIVASNCLPSWAEDLARLYPFLFPFETRHLFLQSTSFGYARSMARWQNAQATEDTRRDRHNERPFLGRLQRQKVRISRQKILESALKVMDLYGASQSILEVEYFEEVGTGLGPTLEFYSSVSKEFSKRKTKLWREIDSTTTSEFASGQVGLFPRPMSEDESNGPNGERILQLFKILGKFVARSMMDSRIIDVHFNSIFFRIGDAESSIKPSLGAIKNVDPGLAQSLKMIKKFALAKKDIDEDAGRTAAQKVEDTGNIVIDNVRLEDLCLDFTLPGYPDVELEKDGAQKRVTIENVDLYLEKVIDLTLGSGVRKQVDAFRAGFSTVFPYSALSAFTPEELVALFGKADEDWSLESKFWPMLKNI